MMLMMPKYFRKVFNLLYRSAHWFDDGTAAYHLTRYNIIRYFSGEPVRRITDIPLLYDETTGRLRINDQVIWKWRAPGVPLQEWSDTGPELSDVESRNLSQKLSFFVTKQSKHFEPFK